MCIRDRIYRVLVEDRIWGAFYHPVANAVLAVAAWVGHIQRGRISAYLLYSFLTLLILLVIVL